MHKTKYKIKRVTVNLPAQLVAASVKSTQLSLTETLITALSLLQQRQAYDVLQQMKGKVNLKVDLTTSRERS